MMLPKGSLNLKLIIVWCHKKIGHTGRGTILNEIRMPGFWIVCANSSTHKFMHYCVVCWSLREKYGEQKNVELSFHRLQERPSFTYCGVELFGIFVICSKQKELKRSDNRRSNFVRAVKELWKCFQGMNQSRINLYLQMQRADWITWINNPSTNNHMEVWKRQIRTARGILNALVKTHEKRLGSKSLHTLLIKVEAIVHSGLMTTKTISDVKSDIPL